MTGETRPGMPFAGSTIARYLDKQIDTLKGVKTQREIAFEIGYEKPNMISMFKRGEVKVPLDKIPALAKAVNADPGHLFRLALEQYWPTLGETIQRIFGRTVTANEEEISSSRGGRRRTTWIQLRRQRSGRRPSASCRVWTCATARRLEGEGRMRRPKMPRMPYADTELVMFLDKRINAPKAIRSEEEIAKILWLRPSGLAKLRRGEIPFPLDRVFLLALAIDGYPANVFRLALDQHWPDLQEKLSEFFGYIATPNEAWILLRKWREATENLDPDTTPDLERAVDQMIANVKVIRSTL